MLLTFNISNSEISLGAVENGMIAGRASVSCGVKTVDEYACVFKNVLELHGFFVADFDSAIGSSVVPSLTDTVVSALTQLLGIRVHILGAGTKTGLNILTDDPSQLGGDLVASAVGALSKYKPPMILVDLGVAATFSVIDKDGCFVGCAIAPGVSLSVEALSRHTGLLPHIANIAPQKCIGTTTVGSMQSGAVFGAAAMVDGMIKRIEEELGYTASVIGSGDKAGMQVISSCNHDIVRDDTLIFEGLARIYEKNSKKKTK